MEKKILESLVSIDQNKKMILCSIIHQSGSIPRKDYPVMLVFENGDSIGTIGGGKLEYNVIKLASTSEINTPKIINHEMRGKDAYGDSGICGGKVTVLLEPYLDLHIQHFKNVQKLLESSPILIKTTVINPNRHPKVFWDVVSVQDPVDENGDIVDQTSKSHCNINKIVVSRYVPQNSTLHIFGAGHV